VKAGAQQISAGLNIQDFGIRHNENSCPSDAVCARPFNPRGKKKTRTDVRQYAEDRPVFRETAEKMVTTWETGLATLFKKE
jgi:hypothetical protein